MGGLSKSLVELREFSDEVFESFRTAELTCTDTSRRTVLLLGLYAREMRNCWGRILVSVDEFLCNIFAYVLLLSMVNEGGSDLVDTWADSVCSTQPTMLQTHTSYHYK